MVKPTGPACNLDCEYCFYLEKSALFPSNEDWKMSEQTAEHYVREYIAAQPEGAPITFAWQGGEPTLCGVEFFRKIVRWQKEYGRGRRIENALQTNGTLINDAWAAFFKKENFLIGVSIDGPEKLHNRYRLDRRGKGTFHNVMRGIDCLRKHGVEFNTLTCVNRHNVNRPEEVYRFLRGIGSTYLQFIPIVERQPDSGASALGLEHAMPPDLETKDAPEAVPRMTPWSVPSKAFGEFLVAIFNRWIRHDVGRIYVQAFDVALGQWLGIGGGLCVHEKTCGNALAMEHDGSLYSCDHYVYPEHRVGRLGEGALKEFVEQPAQRKFGEDKRDRLPQDCRECPVLFACNGGCPKHRFKSTAGGEPGLNYLCQGYRHFFTTIDPYMQVMAHAYRNGRPPAGIMDWLKGEGRAMEKRWGYPLGRGGRK